jgi:hypothetical protein
VPSCPALHHHPTCPDSSAAPAPAAAAAAPKSSLPKVVQCRNNASGAILSGAEQFVVQVCLAPLAQLGHCVGHHAAIHACSRVGQRRVAGPSGAGLRRVFSIRGR